MSTRTATRLIPLLLLVVAVCLVLGPIGVAAEEAVDSPPGASVTVIQPGDGATDVPLDTVITVVFSSPMVALTVEADQADLPSPIVSEPEIAGSGEWVNTAIYRFAPSAGLDPSTAYTLSLAPDLAGLSGAPVVGPSQWSFTTVAPHLVSYSPLPPGDWSADHPVGGAWPNEPVKLSFAQPMDRASVEDALTVSYVTNGMDAVEGKIRWFGNTLVFTPSTSWARGSQIEVVLDGAQAVAGASMEPISWVFPVMPELALVSSSPEDGAEGVYPGTSLVLEFSAPVDPDSFKEQFAVEPKPENFYVWWSSQTSVYVDFYPVAGEQYTATIGSDLVDSRGGRLGEDITISFGTGDYGPSVQLTDSWQPWAFGDEDEPAAFVSYLNVHSYDLALYEMPLADAVRYYGDDWEFRSSYKPKQADLLRAWTVEPDGERNSWATVSEPLVEGGGALTPGLYYLTLESQDPSLKGSVSGQVLVVASHNVTLKWTADASLAWVTDWHEGDPAGDLPVHYLDSRGRQFGEAVTEEDGTALAAMVEQDSWLAHAVVVGEPGSDAFGMTLSSWTNGISPWRYGVYQYGSSSPYAVHIYTDRPMYRPGQTVYFKGIVRSDDDARYSVPTDLPPLELVCSDAQGQEIMREQFTLNEMGTFYGSLALSEAAPLGQFSLYLSGADQLGAWAGFEVAQYRRPEFEVTVTPDQERYIQGDEVKVAIEALYYFGAPVTDAQVQWAVLTQDWYFYWDEGGYYDFSDYDYLREREDFGPGSGLLTEGTGRTDEEGRLVISFPAEIADRLSSQVITIEATVTDVNAQAVSGRSTVPVQQGEYFVGVGPDSYVVEAGGEAVINVATVDGAGEAVAGREVELTLYEHRWYNAYEKVGDYYQWTTTEEDVEVARQTVTTGTDGKAGATFVPESAGSHKVVATSTDDRGNEVRSSSYFWVTGAGYVAWPMQEDFTFELVADKKAYEVGDTAKIMVPSPYEGQVAMLFTAERGQVLDYRVLDLEGSASVLEVPITADFAPNVYFTAVLVRGADEEASLPPFQIGYVGVEVAIDALQLDITVSADQEEPYEPGDAAEFEIAVTDHEGTPVDAEMSVSLVDKALLALTGAPTSLVDYFYSQRGLGVQTASLYTLYTRELERLAEAAGKGGGGGGAGGVREDFPETAYWEPDLRTDAAGEAAVEVTLPDNLTTWTFEVKAITADTLVGQQSVEIVATKELLLRPVLPRFLVVGDTAQIGAVVQNGGSDALEVTVQASLDGMEAELEPRVVTVEGGGRQLVTWTVAAERRGTATATFSATGGGLDDAVRMELPVYPMVTAQTVATSGEVPSGGEVLEEVILPSEFSEGELTVTVEASLVAGMIPGLDYLRHYPYECVEQTLSRFLPNVVTAKALEEVGADNTALIRELSQQVGIGLQRLYSNQHGDGGWGWWYNDESNPYLSAYVVWGLVKARDAGYTVAPYAIDRGVEFLRSVVFELDVRSDQEAHELGPEVRAYIAYVLAEAGQGDLGLTVRLFEERERLSFRATAHLLMALAILSPDEPGRIEALVDDLEAGAVLTATTTHWEDEVQWRLMNTDAIATATVIQALSRVSPDHPLLPNAVRWLMSVRGQGYWSSTYETAVSLLGLTEYMVAKQELLAKYAWSLAVNGREVGSGEFDAENLDEAATLVVDVYRLLSQEPNELVLTRSPLPETDADTGSMYYTAALAYYADAEEIAPVDSGVIVSRQYLTADGEGPALHAAAINDTVQVRVTVVAPTDLWHVVVEDPLPAGFEGLDTSLRTTATVGVQPQFRAVDEPWGWWWFSHTEMRDDKVVLFATHLPKGTYEYTYYMRASIAGQFNVRPTLAYQMYFPDVFGNGAGETFTVEALGE
ncbi:MAG: hypothetical protein GXX93_08745 [Anaerolineae bacterium]|nr:hypothetical protein [Anaerolineae bacterium]